MCVAGAWLLCPAGLLQHQADSEVFPLPTATSVLGSLCPFLSKMYSQLQPAWRDSLINDSHCSLTGAGAPVDHLPWPETRAFQEKKRPVMSLPPGPGGMWHQRKLLCYLLIAPEQMFAGWASSALRRCVLKIIVLLPSQTVNVAKPSGSDGLLLFGQSR